MIRGRCPICGQTYEIQALTELPTYPFCSERCRLVDLGRWIDGNYVIPGGPPEQEQEEKEDLSAD